MFYFVIFFIFIFYVSYKYLKTRSEILKYSTKLPGPKPLPLLGNVLMFPSDPNDVFLVFMSFPKLYGKNNVAYGLLNDLGIMVSDLKDVERILSNSGPTKKAKEYIFLEKWLGTGLLISSGKKWFQRRKIITPAFHFSVLEQFMDVFNRQTNTFNEKIDRHANTNIDFDIYHYTTLLALDAICEASMGISLDAQNEPDLDYVRSVKELSILFYRRIFSPFKQFLWLYDYTKDGKRQMQLLKILHKFTDDVICARRETLLQEQHNNTNNNNNNEIDDDQSSPKKKMTFLDILLNATVDGQPLTNNDIREEVDTFMFEGHDTTTSGIAFTLYNISQHADVQNKLYEEILTFTGNDQSKTVSYSDLHDMRYLDMVVKESLRLYPPVPMMGRCLMEETKIGDANVPAGINITIPVYAIHRDPDLYENPEEFIPERFTFEGQQSRSPFAYIPFSAGSRNCIGQRFALLEIKSTVTKLLQKYKLLPCDADKPIKLQADLVLKSTTGVYVKIEKRH